MRQVIPSDYIKNSIEVYTTEHSTTSQRIYVIVLLTLVVTIVLLPFIYVNVSIQDPGVVRPMNEKTEIKSAVTELVDSVYVREGMEVKQGDTLLTFRQNSTNYQLTYLAQTMKEYDRQVADLAYLATGQKPDTFQSNMRMQEYALYQQQLEESTASVAKARRDFKRNKSLYEKDIIAEEEYENYRHEYDRLNEARTSFKKKQLATWQTDLNQLTLQLHEMHANYRREVVSKERYAIISPIAGTLDQFRGIYKNSLIQAGASVAVVSPDTQLYAEVHVSSRHIGYLRVGMPVQIQVGAFNYNEWGTVAGAVLDISSDIITDISGENAFYLVKCIFDSTMLTRKNGVKGYLKKGMVLSAHFMITRRSLFDLFYQKIDDWVNPTQYTLTNKKG